MTKFESQGLFAGTWSGILTAAQAPGRVFLAQYGEVLALARIEAGAAGTWNVAVDLPASVLSDGVHTLALVADSGKDQAPVLPDAEHLDHLKLIAGTPLDNDLATEIALLRSEMELLKRELRRLATGD